MQHFQSKTAHIARRPVLGRHEAGMQACVEINKNDDDRQSTFKDEKKQEYCVKEKNRKQQVMELQISHQTIS